MNRLCVLGTLLLLAGPLGATELEPEQAARAARKVRQIVAHRGSSIDRPENTLASYRRAIEVGATVTEIDVRTTKDGVLVSAHDAELRRTTNGTGLVGDKTLAQLKELDAGSRFDPKFKDERIPTVREILELCRGRIDVMLDLKETGEAYAVKVADEVRKHGNSREIVVGVRSVTQAQEFRRLLPEARQIGLIPGPNDIEAFAAAGAETIRLWPKWLGDTTLVPRVRKAGAKLHLSAAAGTTPEVLALLPHGPESLSSDDPARLIQTLKEIARTPADLGSRLELFVDADRIDSLKGARLVLHSPQPMEKVLTLDQPWEGAVAAYFTVFRDGDLVRMYYRGWVDEKRGGDQVTCYAESKDGIHWSKPELGLVDFQGSKKNNILRKGPPKEGTHNFTPFKDTRPGVPPDQLYKALAGGPLSAYVSGDGIHWRLLTDKPVLTKGAFDSQNLAFWDPSKKKYVSYFRVFINKIRAVALAESEDFIHWSEPVPIDLGSTPREHFYTNATLPYFRAPHYYFSFPKRFVPDRKRLPEHSPAGISEAVFLSSRDGLHFDRTFMEAFIRPGPDPLNWGDRATMPAWGLLPTGPGEMSVYYSQHYRYPSHHIRRGVLRLDGIASAHADYAGGELVTTPVRFAGKNLILNFATAAIGSVRVEIQDVDGKPLPGFSLADARELYGDAVAEAYSWKTGKDVSALAGKPVRLRFVLKDADVYSYRFGD